MCRLSAVSDFLKEWLRTQPEYRNRPDQGYQVELAVIEACTNIIRHAYPEGGDPWLCLSLRRNGPAVEILILDRGKPFDPRCRPDPDLQEPGEGGYGIYLIRQIMTGLEYRRRGRRWNSLRLTHRISPTDAESAEGRRTRC